MTQNSLIALFSAMLILAIIPGPAVFAIIARSFSSGFLRGLYMTLGIIVADYLFIILALFGLTALSELMGTTFFIIKYLSAAYLIWLGIKLLRSKSESVNIQANKESSLLSSFMAGLLLTLGNPKAILFYLGFFPAFVEVGNVAFSDIGLIMVVATIAIGSVNLCYAYLAIRAKRIFKSPKATKVINKTAGTIMVSTGLVVAVRS